jgi:hypothetical protein
VGEGCAEVVEVDTACSEPLGDESAAQQQRGEEAGIRGWVAEIAD